MLSTSFIRTVSLAGLLLAPSAFAAEWLVGVGKDENTGKKGLGFDPSVISPAVGDTIVWEFRSGAHSVVQSTFANPCTASGGYTTGVQTVDDGLSVDASGLPQIRLLVNDTQPLWFFDDAGGLCTQGAVVAINPSSTQTAAAFKANAMNGVAQTTGSDSSDSTTTTTASKTSSGSSVAPASSSGSASATSASTSASPTGNSGSAVLPSFVLLAFGMMAVFI